MSLRDQIVQAAGGCGEHIHARPQLFHLGRLPHTAENDGVPHRQPRAVGSKTFVDLQRQLPGGRQHQRAHRAGAVSAAAAVHQLQNGHGKRRCFAGARLGASQKIPPGQNRRDGLLLNGRRLCISGRVRRCENGRDQVQFTESHDKILSC